MSSQSHFQRCRRASKATKDSEIKFFGVCGNPHPTFVGNCGCYFYHQPRLLSLLSHVAQRSEALTIVYPGFSSFLNKNSISKAHPSSLQWLPTQTDTNSFQLYPGSSLICVLSAIHVPISQRDIPSHKSYRGCLIPNILFIHCFPNISKHL